MFTRLRSNPRCHEGRVGPGGINDSRVEAKVMQNGND